MNRIVTKHLQLNEISEKDFDFLFTVDAIPECDEFNTLGIPKNIA